MKKISILIGIIISFCTLIGIVLATDKYVAKAKDLAITNLRLEQKITQDYNRDLQERIWKIEDRYGTDCAKMPESVRKIYRDMKEEQKLQDKILEQMIKQVQEKGK